MKRRTSLLLLFLTAWLLTVPALADVAWEPENSFYKRNERQCEPEERFYWVNGPEGYLTLRTEWKAHCQREKRCPVLCKWNL